MNHDSAGQPANSSRASRQCPCGRLAAMGVSGGFLAPILASTGGGSHVMLFSFYALLNFGILVIA